MQQPQQQQRGQLQQQRIQQRIQQHPQHLQQPHVGHAAVARDASRQRGADGSNRFPQGGADPQLSPDLVIMSDQRGPSAQQQTRRLDPLGGQHPAARGNFQSGGQAFAAANRDPLSFALDPANAAPMESEGGPLPGNQQVLYHQQQEQQAQYLQLQQRMQQMHQQGPDPARSPHGKDPTDGFPQQQQRQSRQVQVRQASAAQVVPLSFDSFDDGPGGSAQQAQQARQARQTFGMQSQQHAGAFQRCVALLPSP